MHVLEECFFYRILYLLYFIWFSAGNISYMFKSLRKYTHSSVISRIVKIPRLLDPGLKMKDPFDLLLKKFLVMNIVEGASFNPSRPQHFWKLHWNKNKLRPYAFIKPLEAPQRSVKIKIWLNFLSSSWAGTGRVNFSCKGCTFHLKEIYGIIANSGTTPVFFTCSNLFTGYNQIHLP